MTVFTEVTLIIVIAFFVSIVMLLLKQPLIIGYIISGVIVGPFGLGILRSVEVIELLSKLGITALLFIVGLSLSPKVIKELGPVSIITGVGQVVFTTIIGFFLCKLLGYSDIQAFYISVAITFSSTIIILKLLSDKGDLHALYGRISIGFLLVQDFIATILLVVISAVSRNGADNPFFAALSPLLKGFVLLVFLGFFSSKILPKFSTFLAKSQELLFIGSVAWGIGIGLLYFTLGLSVEIGALVAGVSLSMTPYAFEISARMKPLRDFFIILFFILLGSQLVFKDILQSLLPTVVLSFFILVGNPLILLVIMNLLGFTKKTSFLTGLNVAQISEFSLILVALGFSVGHLTQNEVTVMTMIGIVTISVSSYFIIYSERIYEFLKPVISLFEIKKTNKDMNMSHKDCKALLFGCHRVGLDFIKVFRDLGIDFLVVDHDPNVVKKLTKKGVHNLYGDISDPDFLEELPISELSIAISTVPDFTSNLNLVKRIRVSNSTAIILVISDNVENSVELYEAGASYVIMPHYVGAQIASEMLHNYKLDTEKYLEAGKNHIKYLKHRKELLA